MADADLSSELSAAAIIDRIHAGSVPEQFLQYASRGLLPLPQDELVAVLSYLTRHHDETVAVNARRTLSELPPPVILGFARAEASDPDLLDALAGAVDDEAVTEAILRNRATSDRTIERLARSVSPHLQEVIVINQARILRAPSILDSLTANPELASDVRRRAGEIREEFLERAVPAPEEIEEPALTPEETEAISDLLEKAETETDESGAQTVPQDMPLSDDQIPIFNRILNMTVSERVRLAYKGGRTERAILVRDRNKLVATAVMRNGRLTDSEIEGFATQRNLEEEVLRLIGTNRSWMSKYSILLALVRNPKAPIGVVLPLINRLTLKDLRNASRDRNVSEVVRKSALRLWAKRSKS